MNRNVFVWLCAAAMMLPMLSGCSVFHTVRMLDAAEEQLEQQIDRAEEQIEAELRQEVPSDAMPRELLPESEALGIALAHAGLSEDLIEALRIEYEIDDRVPEYEIEFHHDRMEYDYTIHAETGEILSWDRDN